jgi:CRISPR-associated protein Csm4
MYISTEAFQTVIGGQANAAPVIENVIASFTRVQTAIDREMGAGAEGQLFETDAKYLTAPCNTLTVYIRSERFMDEITACFKALAWMGFGKKSSTGLGQFEVFDGPDKCDWLDGVPGADAWVTLNHFVPAPRDPTDGRWRTHVTYPKFHGSAAANVFKGSILMLTPGSVFRTNGEAPRPWYGSMISVPRPEAPKALHYALSFAVPVLWSPQAQ